ncbi:MAG: response regulator [Chloroflexota bacterium]
MYLEAYGNEQQYTASIEDNMNEDKLVLIIDDEEPVREAVADILELEGVLSLAAANGHEGLALYSENQAKIDVVLLDLSMPGLSGMETLTRLHEIDPEVQVVLSSGYSEHDARRRFQSIGFAGFIQKPYDIQTFINEMKRHFSPTPV